MERTKCEVFTRVVGYIRPVENWNRGKREEYKDRVVYKEDVSLEAGRCMEGKCKPLEAFNEVH